MKLKLAGALTVGALMIGLIGAPAVFAKGGGGGGGHHGGGSTTGSGTIVLAMVPGGDLNGDGQPNWGDTVTFQVSTTATTEPHVNVTCSQNGAVVYGASTGYYASYPWPWTQNMTLSSQTWTGGAAACTAVLQAYSGTSVSTLATLNFSVAA